MSAYLPKRVGEKREADLISLGEVKMPSHHGAKSLLLTMKQLSYSTENNHNI